MSTIVNLVVGAAVESGGIRYTITHLLDLETVLCKEEGGEKSVRLHIKDLTPITHQSEDEQKPETELADVSDEDWREANRRFQIIRPLLAASHRTREGVAEQGRMTNVHVTTVYRWIDAYERSGRVSALLPTRRPGGRGKSRLPSEVEAIVKATVEDFYLNSQKRSSQKTCEEVIRRCRNAGVTPPHMNTVRNRIAQLSEEMKIERRISPKKAREKFSPIAGHFPGADFPLAVIQIDHTPLDIVLVDDTHRRPVGRPWITLAIDVFSRMVAGFYISFDPPGALSTGLCVAHAILPKEKWLTRHDITTPWSCWGVMKKIHVDNAKEFRGNMLKRACEEYGIELDWRPVATPHYGGHIERLLGTLLTEIHSLPGTTFSNPRERGEYDSEAKAAMTLFELEKWLATYIVEVYHQRVHSALKMSPVKKYEQGIFGTKDQPGVGLPARTVEEERLRLDFMPYVERTVQGYGVVIDDVHYYSDVLRRFINAADPDDSRRKRQFIFKRDPRDISVVYFFDPELMQYSAIPYRDTSHPPISLWEFREVRRQLVTEGRELIDESLIFDAYERMRQQEEKAVRETKRVRRANQKRAMNARVVKPKAVIEQPITGTDEPQLIGTFKIEPFDELEDII